MSLEQDIRDQREAENDARSKALNPWYRGPAPIFDPLLSVEQVAAYTRLSVSYLNRLRHAGGGCPYSKIGVRCLYRQSDVDEWVNGKRRRSTADTGEQGGGANDG